MTGAVVPAAVQRSVTASPESGLTIAHVIAPAPFGGLESVVQALAIGQARSGHAVHLVTIVDAGAPEPEVARAVRAGGVTVHALPVPPRAYARERRDLGRLLDRLRPDIVHTHGYRPDLQARTVAQRSGACTVTTLHGFCGGDWKNRAYEWLQRRAARRFDATVAVSHRLARELRDAGVSAERLHAVPNAYGQGTEFLDRHAARAELNIPDDRPTAGFIGRLGREKGPDIFIAALRQLDEPRPRAIVIGDGVMREQLMAASDGLDVQWPGAVPAAARLIRALDVVVLSSRTEGTPMVLLEAMAAGVPIVATRVGGIPEVVDEQHALLVPAEDPRAIRDAVRAVLADPAAAEQRARRARQRLATHFGPDVWVERYSGIYRSSLATRKGSR